MTIHTFYLLIFYVSLSVTLIAAYISVSNSDRAVRPMVALVWTSAIFDLTLGISADIFNYYIPYVGYFYRIIEFLIIIEFYFSFLQKKIHRHFSRIIQVLIPMTFILFFEWSSSYFRLLNSIIFCLAPIALYFHNFKTLSFGNILESPVFWANTAIFIYFSGNLFLFLMFKSIASSDKDIALASYCLHNGLLITRNVVLAISFIKSKNIGVRTYARNS